MKIKKQIETAVECPLLYFTPKQIANRWQWHPESVRRKIRRREILSIVLGRRRMVPLEELQRLEANGTIPVTLRLQDKNV